jgi:hypothetical protein
LATADQVGSSLKCPDCGSLTVVPPMPPRRKKIDVMAGADEGYELAPQDEEVLRSPPPPPSRLPQDETDEPAEPEAEPKRPRRRPVLPDRPFLDGTFSFPFAQSVRVRTLVLSLWAIMPAVLASAALSAGAEESITSWFTCAMLLAPSVILGVMWLIAASAAGLVVLRDTSEGCDAIVDWPGHVFLDWMGGLLHLFCSACAGAVPGAALVFFLGKEDAASKVLLWSMSLFVLFPIILMSTLETNSALGVLSWPTWKTLGTATMGWVKFYVVSAVLCLGTVAIGWAAFWLHGFIGAVVGAAVLTTAWIVYFRLLGRLAWYCADRAARAAAEAGADDEEFDEEYEEAVDNDDLI